MSRRGRYTAAVSSLGVLVAWLQVGTAGAVSSIGQPPATASSPGSPTQVDVSGYYFIAGKRPAGFANFHTFQLDQQEAAGVAAGRLTGNLTLKRHVKGKDPYDFWQFAQVTLDGAHLSFTSEERNDERYSFSGDFLRLGNLAMLVGNDKEIVLKGQLTKFRHGKIVSHAEVKFGYFMGG
jgi:hypothetical protein